MPAFLNTATFWIFVIAVCSILFLLFGGNWLNT